MDTNSPHPGAAQPGPVHPDPSQQEQPRRAISADEPDRAPAPAHSDDPSQQSGGPLPPPSNTEVRARHEAVVRTVMQALQARGRNAEVRGGEYLVLESGVAFSIGDISFTHGQALAAGKSPEQAAHSVVDVWLEREQRHLDSRDDQVQLAQVRLRVVHPSLLDEGPSLPGPAGLIVYPVWDTPDSATRLVGETLAGLGGLEEVGVTALRATLAEPIGAPRIENLAGGRFLGVKVEGDIYTASRVLDMQQLLGESGALTPETDEYVVMVPNSREVWVMPRMPDVNWRDLAREAGLRTRELFDGSRGQVSPYAYIWSGGRLHQATGLRDGEVVIAGA